MEVIKQEFSNPWYLVHKFIVVDDKIKQQSAKVFNSKENDMLPNG